MSTARVGLIAAVLAGAACRPGGPPSAAPQPASAPRTYLLRLGSDTIAVDQFTMSRDQVEGTLVTHLPRTVVTRYSVTIDPATRRASRITYNSRLVDGSLIPGGPQGSVRQVTIEFVGDSAIARIQRDTMTTVRVAAPSAFPYITYSMAFFQLPVNALRATGRDSASYGIYTGGRVVTPIVVQRTGPDAYAMSLGGFSFAVRTNPEGVVQVVDGAGTTQQFVATLQPAPIDGVTLAGAWAAAERNRGTSTALSIRDTTTATVGSAALWVDYGRPLTRGRQVWGANGVLNDTLWRTGANAATQFRTSQPLTIGGRQLPAGTYTLWTLAVPGRYQLIFNRQTGQWGTQYDPGQDVLRVPAEARELSAPVEQFTIAVEPTGATAGVIRLQWGNRELTVPFTTP